MKTINNRAIETLEATLAKGKELREEEFYFGAIVHKWDDKNNCGTACCLAGWYPLWFPESKIHWVAMDGWFAGLDEAWCDKMNEYHNINDRLFHHIFHPGCQNTMIFGGRDLYSDSTLPEVLSNLSIVIEKLKSGEIDGLE